MKGLELYNDAVSVYQVLKFMNPDEYGGYNGLFGILEANHKIADWDSYYACLYGHWKVLNGIALPIKLDSSRKRVVFDQFSGKASRSFASMWDTHVKSGDTVKFYLANISQSSGALQVDNKADEICFEFTQD